MAVEAAARVSPAWEVASEAARPEAVDPLLACLVALTKLFERPYSPEALRAGLPLDDGRLTPALFLRAAARAGLTGKIVRRELTQISAFVLPAVLLLDQREACVLLRVRDDGMAEVLLPETGEGIHEVAFNTLAHRYTGHAVFVRPEYRYDGRLGEEEVAGERGWFWGTLVRFWRVYTQVFVAAALINSFGLAVPLFTMNVYDRVVPNNATETLWVLSIGILLVLGFDLLLRTLRGYFVDVAGSNADVLLSAKIFEQVMNLRLAARPPSAGGFANVLKDFETVRDFFASASVTAVVDVPFIALYIAIIAVIGGPLALVPLAMVPLVVGVGWLLQYPLRDAVIKSQHEAAQKHGVLVETIGGLETIKSLNAQGRLQRKWEQFVGMTARSSQRSRTLSLAGINISVFAQQAAYILVIIYGVYLVAEGELTVGALIAVSILTSRAVAPLGQVAGILSRLHQSMAALKALNKIMASPVERPAGHAFLNRPVLNGAIQFRDVSFSYPGADIAALDGLNLRINPGERVGIIGRIGSGKSTLAKLILGLYQGTSGEVLVDGTDVRQIDPADLRRNIGSVLQDALLFHGSVRDNIAIGSPFADDAMILKASRIAGADEFVRRHPKGYDLMIGERGEGLSGGQRQTIAMARAVLTDPSVLVLDEPTSGMDNGSERQLIARLGEVLPGRTLVLITHRASLLVLVERIVVVDRGKVVADGRRDEILRQLNSGEIRVTEG